MGLANARVSAWIDKGYGAWSTYSSPCARESAHGHPSGDETGQHQTHVLKVGPEVSGRDALGSLDKRNLERLGVTLVDNKPGPAPKAWADTAAGVLVLASAAQGGSYVRDDGVFVVISSVDRVDHAGRPGALAITFHYYVTSRKTGRAPVICFEEWRVVLAPGGAGWEIVQTRTLGHC
jgi:hypothetical protein